MGERNRRIVAVYILYGLAFWFYREFGFEVSLIVVLWFSAVKLHRIAEALMDKSATPSKEVSWGECPDNRDAASCPECQHPDPERLHDSQKTIEHGAESPCVCRECLEK